MKIDKLSDDLRELASLTIDNEGVEMPLPVTFNGMKAVMRTMGWSRIYFGFPNHSFTRCFAFPTKPPPQYILGACYTYRQVESEIESGRE